VTAVTRLNHVMLPRVSERPLKSPLSGGESDL
jgi:hypothetical protein